MTIDDPIEQLAPLEREAQAWVMRFAAGAATAADLQALQHWCGRSPAHAAAFAKASRLWEALGPAGQEISRRQHAAVQAPASSSAPRRMGRRAVLGGALAASAAALGYGLTRPPFGLWPSLSELAADYRTATGEQKRITLAGGISIEMSAQTSIALRSTAQDADRIELVAGEAAIAARSESAKPLTVIAGNGRTMTRQASFDIRYVGASVGVTCLEGEIRVEQGSAAASLQARQQLIYSVRGMSSVRAIDPAVVTAWRDGFLIFHATPLAEAVEEVNRYRPGRIILVDDALGRRLFNARFRIENVDEVVDQIEHVFGARATSLPGGIVLLG